MYQPEVPTDCAAASAADSFKLRGKPADLRDREDSPFRFDLDRGDPQTRPAGSGADIGIPALSAWSRLEALRGDRNGQYSIRINDQFRICFRWTLEGPTDVEIVDYH
jgi:hypothetical protein